MTEKLQAVVPEIQRRFPYRVGLLAKKFQVILKEDTPVDTGNLQEGWKYEIKREGDVYTIMAWNTAESEEGVMYAEFVNDGHRIVQRGETIGWVDGQFFIESSEARMSYKFVPNWKTSFEREIARLIKNAIS